MTATKPELDTPLVELVEARTRRLMAERASLPCDWAHRQARRDLLGMVDASLDEHNDLMSNGGWHEPEVLDL